MASTIGAAATPGRRSRPWTRPRCSTTWRGPGQGLPFQIGTQLSGQAVEQRVQFPRTVAGDAAVVLQVAQPVDLEPDGPEDLPVDVGRGVAQQVDDDRSDVRRIA